MGKSEQIIAKYAPELYLGVIKLLSEPHSEVSMMDTSTMIAVDNPLRSHYVQFLRNIQIIRDSYEIVCSSKNLNTLKSRISIFHQKIYDVSPFWKLLDGMDLREVFTIIDNYKINAHTAFYVNDYLFNIEKSNNSKRQVTKDKYYVLALGGLKSGTTDKVADQDIINSYLDKHKNDPLFETIKTMGGIQIVVDGKSAEIGDILNQFGEEKMPEPSKGKFLNKFLNIFKA